MQDYIHERKAFEKAKPEPDEDPRAFRDLMRQPCPQLATLPNRLFSISIHAASVELLLSTMGNIQTKRRNRLKFVRLFKIANVSTSLLQLTYQTLVNCL